MGNVRVKLAGACMIAALMVGGFAAPPVGAATQASAKVHFAGSYVVHLDWQIIGKGKGNLILKANHTGDDGFDDAITWSSTGKDFQMTIVTPGPTAIYHGTSSKKGIDTKKNPGTMSNDQGDTGTWYAALQPPG